MAIINADVTNVEPQRSLEPVPAGRYGVQITSSEMLQTKSRNGSYLKLEFTVLDGPDGTIGRKLWTNLNLDNPNKQAVEIAYSELSAIAHAVGHPGRIEDSEELHGIPLEVDVKIREDVTGKYQPSNEITGYRPVAGAAPAPARAPATSSAPPWERRA